ncbi:tetratricopeptide repeat protein [Spirochaetota bacterium]
MSFRMLKRIIILVLIGLTVYASLNYSSDIYIGYMKFYYKHVKRKSLNDMISDARRMYKNKKYVKLNKHIETLIIVHPENRQLKKIAGFNYIKLGQEERGVNLLLSSFAGEKIPGNILHNIIRILFKKKDYMHVVEVLDDNNHGNDLDMMHMYGISLYKTGEYKKALGKLIKVAGKMEKDYKLFYYIGRSFENLNDLKNAARYLDHARKLNYLDADVNQSLVRVYRKRGKLEMAEMILRAQKNIR